MKLKTFQTKQDNIIKKSLAILLIITLTMVNFVIIGTEAVSYAADMLSDGTATNNRNVTFDAFFKNANGTAITNEEQSIINKDIKLYMQICVKNDGYFNGAISLGDSNFNLKDKILSKGINKIEKNTVTLNQINSGEKLELEFEIEPIKQDTISLGLLNMLSDVSINGIYRNSEERDIKITATRQVQLTLTNPYKEDEGIELYSEILTNKVYKINEEDKRIVQVLIQSGLKENAYPVKENSIEVSVPQGVEIVKVNSRGRLISNGKEETEFDNSNWNYNEKENKVNILIKNNAENGTIKWLKKGKDNIIITYILPAKTDLIGTEITAKNKITLYDVKNTTKELSTSSKISEEKDGIITVGIEAEENEIYKGKIYSGENREYKVNTNIYVNEAEAGKKQEFNFYKTAYKSNEKEFIANAQYVTTTINKKDVERILGKDGTLTITTNNGQIIEINTNTQSDENDNVVINYSEGTDELKAEITTPQTEGTIALKSTKVLKENGDNKEVKRTYNALKEKVSTAETDILLKETETKAELKVNKTRLSTLAVNENVEITANLLTSSERYDLYSNPTFEITLPESIKTLNVKTIQPLYAEMFNIKEATVIDGNNGAKTIKVSLDGAQTNYSSMVNQATILIVADIEFEDLTPSNSSSITMKYTNENGIQPIYTESKPIEVESKYGLMMNTTMQGYNNNGENITTMDDEVAKGSLDVESNAKVATVKETVINNYDENMQDVNIIGRIPTEGINEGTINTKLVEAIKTDIADAKILYSTDAKAKAEDNTWQESVDGAKAFKINLANLEKGAKVNTEYSFEIPEKLDYGQSIYAKIDTEYRYLGNSMLQSSTVGAETPKLIGTRETTLKNAIETEKGGLKAKIGTTTAGKELNDGDSIYEGQAIQYTTQITNNTGKDLKNVKIYIEQENGEMYGLKEIEVINDVVYKDTDIHFEHRYEELDTNSKELDTIENFENGKTVQFKYEIVANEVEGEAQTQGTIKLKADEFEETTLKTISNKIEQAELKLNYKYYRYEEANLYYGNTLETQLTVQNLSNKELKNVKGKIILPNGTYSENDRYSCYRNDEIDSRISNVKYNKEDNTITFDILEIKPGENEKLEAVFYIDVEEFSQDAIDLTFMAEANTSEKTYYSNQMVKRYNNITKNVTLSQETNISPDKILEDDDEFTITITAKNNNKSNTIATITDQLPECFIVTKANIETASKNEELEIIKSNESEINTDKQSYVLNNNLIGDMLNVVESLNAGEEIKITLNIKVDIGIEQNSVKNIAKLSYGETEADGRYKYTLQSESEKTFNIKPLEVSNEINYVEVSQTSNVENKSILKDGQEIIYNVKVKNVSKDDVNISIKDVLPNGIIAKQVKANNENVTEKAMNKNNTLNLEKQLLGSKQELNLEIVTNYDRNNIANRELSNVIKVVTPENTVLSNSITYYAEASIDGSKIGENNEGSTNGKNEKENSGNYNYTVSGLAWLDENKNGQKDANENLLSGIDVKVIDAETGKFVQENGEDIVSKTLENGTYSFNLQRGNYIVAFMYDSNKYAVTQYQKNGISNKQNSDVISRTIEINGENIEIAATDMIKVISENVTNIDMGLFENTKFDFEFGKYISEITVKTSKGINTYNYDNTNLAKIEIHAKELNNANVIIKYNMKVTNNGEIAGYVKDITDYMPNSLTFNSELNTDWYQSDKNLHNTSLLNTKIGAGETKEITLVLTKNMTENNTGLISNLAELTDVNNEIGVQDLDSTPGNVTQGEDDLGKADVIISVKTGALVSYIGIVLAMLIIIGTGAFVLNRKILKNNIEENINF